MAQYFSLLISIERSEYVMAIMIVCDTEQCKHNMDRVYTNA